MFFFNLSPNIKLPHVLPKDPAFDLKILLSNNEEFLVQKALISEYSRYFQQLSSLKGLTNLTLGPELGNSSLISRVFHAIYGDTVNFEVDELQELDRILDNFDCKRIKDLLKTTLKEQILRTDSLPFFFKVFDHFAIRDHKKFCKESLRRLNELNFFNGITQELEIPQLEKPLLEKPLLEKPLLEKPLLEKPQLEKPLLEKPLLEKPLLEKPQLEKLQLEKPQLEKPLLEKPRLESAQLEKPRLESALLEKARLDKGSFLMNLGLLSERGIIKLLALLLQDQMRQRNGDKAREELCEILKKTVGFYAGELLRRPEKAQGLYQDLLLEVSPMEKKYCDKDVIATLQKEISQLKKANQSLNSQIQGLRVKESENKGRFIGLFKRIERLEKEAKIEEEDHKEKKEIIGHLAHGNKFEEYLANEENKKSKIQKKKNAKNEEIKENSSGKKTMNNGQISANNPNPLNNGEKQQISNKKPKSSFGVFNNEISLDLLIDFLTKTQENYKEKLLVFKRVYEGSKQKFLMKKLVDLCKEGLLQEGVLLLIRTDCDKTIGAFFSEGMEANIAKNDEKSFIFMLNPFRVFSVKMEVLGKKAFFLNEEAMRIGEDLMVFSEGNKSMNSMDLGHFYGENEEIANNCGKTFFLLKELMVLAIKTK